MTLDQSVIDLAAGGDTGARAAVIEWFESASVDLRHTVLDPLALAAAGGARPATELLVDLTHRHRLALPPITSMLVDPADIDDAAQLTLIAVVEKIAQFEGRSRYQTWVRSIARNEALQVLRRKKRKTEASGEEVPEHVGFVRRMSSVVSDQQAIERLLAQLPEEFREALVLREFDGLAYEEISERLAVPVGTVRSRIARARAQLAQFASQLR